MGGVEKGERDRVPADEPSHLFVRQELHGLRGVRDREAVLADEHGQEHVLALSEARREQHRVVRLLRVLDEELDHA